MAMLVADKQFNLSTSRDTRVQVSVFDEVDYLTSQSAMREEVNRSTAPGSHHTGQNQIWLLQHPPVYTLGTACKQQPLAVSDIPVVQSDRGGQITYHGPGQLILYPLLQLRELGLTVKTLVWKLEQAVLDLLTELEIEGVRRENAPGIYVNDAKIAALGLRIRRGMSYHGLSLNVDMNLEPFVNINPCGFQGLRATQVADYHPRPKSSEFNINDLGLTLAKKLCAQL